MVGFMDLPTEVRHRIYQHLLRPVPQPLWLNRHVPIAALRGPDAPYEPDPLFQTQIFRLSKAIYTDSIMYAYGANEFQIREDFATFCNVSQSARSSIRSLKIVPSMWRMESHKEQEMWPKLKQCTNLEQLEVYFHSDILLPAARYLNDLEHELRSYARKPTIALDLCVWEKHMTFDFERDEYERTKSALLEGTEGNDSVNDSRQRIMRLPLQAKQIALTADVSSAALKAFDEYLGKPGAPSLAKSVKHLPEGGTRSIGGRSTRLWYELCVDGS